MDFIERWLYISPDGGNGTFEFLIVTVAIVVIITVAVAALRAYFPRSFTEFLEQLGKRGSSERFDN